MWTWQGGTGSQPSSPETTRRYSGDREKREREREGGGRKAGGGDSLAGEEGERGVQTHHHGAPQRKDITKPTDGRTDGRTLSFPFSFSFWSQQAEGSTGGRTKRGGRGGSERSGQECG